jgi:hypothetical protein
MPLFDRANHVLATLQAAGLGQRPICFVTHSLGGLLVKQMLRNADSLTAEFRPFRAATRGVVFLGTPHTGSDLARVAGYLGALLRSTVATRELEALASPLLELNAWYRENVDRLGIASQAYSENQKTKGVIVVDRGSADPSLQGVAVIGLDADHAGLCKPASRDDLLYTRTCAFILEVISATSQVQSPGERVRSQHHLAVESRTADDAATRLAQDSVASLATPSNQQRVAVPSTASLPPDIATFTGRQDELSRLEAYLRDHHVLVQRSSRSTVRRGSGRPRWHDGWSASCPIRLTGCCTATFAVSRKTRSSRLMRRLRISFGSLAWTLRESRTRSSRIETLWRASAFSCS